MDSPADPGIQRHQLRLDQYRGLAREAELAAAACTLERVREQHQAAAVSWTGLANAEVARIAERRARLDAAIRTEPT